MGYVPLDKDAAIVSGNAIADLLSRTLIKLNGECNVQSVGYADATDELVFIRKDKEPVIIPRENFGVADWDEDEDGQSFYMVMDGQDIVHLFVFYKARNESLEIMRQLKELL
jgi:hypothetical protein